MSTSSALRDDRDSYLFEVASGAARALLVIEPDPQGQRPALARSGTLSLSHLDVELAPALRSLVMELARRFERSAAPLEVLEGSGCRFWRRVAAGQRAPSWPLSLRSGRASGAAPWPFDAERAALGLGLRQAMLREAWSDLEADEDARWLESEGLVVVRFGTSLVAAPDAEVASTIAEHARREATNVEEFQERARALGAAFGTPACCIEHFVRIRRRDDLTLFADALPPAGERAPALSLFLHGALGLISHVPCRPSCPATLELATKVLAALDRERPGFADQWRGFAARLHALGTDGSLLSFRVTDDADGVRLRARDAIEIVAPSPGTPQPLVRPRPELQTLVLDVSAGLLWDQEHRFRSTLFARHDL